MPSLAESLSNIHYASMFKNSIPVATVIGGWHDVSMCTGTPKYQGYIGSPLVGTQLVGSGNEGIYTAGNDSILSIQASTTSINVSPVTLVLCDYVHFYPLVDLESDYQEMVNTMPLQRHTDGKNLKIMAVASSPIVGDGIFTINYTDSFDTDREFTMYVKDGRVAGNIPTATNLAAQLDCPWLFDHNRGITKINSVTAVQASSGFIALVVVKPICHVSILEQSTPSEVSFPGDRGNVPMVHQNACLNFVMARNSGNVANNLMVQLLMTKIGD
jgi:hypothetical protein